MPLPADTKKTRFRAVPILVAVGALVAACSRLPIDLPSWRKSAEAPAASAPAKAPAKAAKVPGPPAPRPPGSDTAQRPPSLVGLSEEETASLLGPPAEIAQRPPGKVWFYGKNECRLAVHLFPDVSGAGFFALDYTARDDDKEACLARMIEAARRKG